MIHIIIGTKAQLIKMAPVMALLEKKSIPYNFIFTSQHKEKINDLLDNFNLKKPDYILYRGKKDITSTFQMGIWFVSCVVELWRNKITIFKNDKQGIVLVHGDTFSTLLGALMGKLAGLKVGHVESGLRSFNLFHPFPEEITRLLTFKLSNSFFCSSNWAIQNLNNEKGEKINLENNTLIDSVNLALSLSERSNVTIPDKSFGIVSMHRYENIFNRENLDRCIKLIETLANKYPLLFILHLPTEKQLKKFNFYERLKSNPNIEMRPRYDYFDFIALLKKSELLITDGGSNQEECSYIGHPCLLLRQATERQEGLGENVVLSEYDENKALQFIKNLAAYKYPRKKPKRSPSHILVQKCASFQ